MRPVALGTMYIQKNSSDDINSEIFHFSLIFLTPFFLSSSFASLVIFFLFLERD